MAGAPRPRAPAPAPAGAGREARRVALAIALTMVLWMGAQWLGGRLGLDARLVLLCDAAALLAFGWALWRTWTIWQRDRRA